jgi:hypothetical protein
MTSEMGEMFNEYKKARQEKRAQNRDSSAEYLTRRNIAFNSRNGGAHLIVHSVNGLVDFWPGTGLWQIRSGRRGFGVKALVAFIEKSQEPPK